MRESRVRAFTRTWVSLVYGQPVPIDIPDNLLGELVQKAMPLVQEQVTNSDIDNVRANRLLASVFPNGI